MDVDAEVGLVAVGVGTKEWLPRSFDWMHCSWVIRKMIFWGWLMPPTYGSGGRDRFVGSCGCR